MNPTKIIVASLTMAGAITAGYIAAPNETHIATLDDYKTIVKPLASSKHIRVEASATTTADIPANDVYAFDTKYTPQGACLKIKDADGSGYTYLTANNGVLSPSVESCE